MMGNSTSFVPDRDIGSLEGKVILVTGGNAGLGKQTIQYLASHNAARIYLCARSADKAKSAISDIQSAVPNTCEIVHLPLDLTSFSSIASCASSFTARESRLDILINNAGVMAVPYSQTHEGYEIQFGTNHMGHALLTKLLLPTLLQTAEADEQKQQTGSSDVRIVNLTSMGHHLAPSSGIIWDQATLEQKFTFTRYGQSKLANILFTRELASRYPSITSAAIHPGVIVTDLYSAIAQQWCLKVPLALYKALTPYLPGHFKDASGGALNQTWAAAGAKKGELKSGGFYNPVAKEAGGSGLARDEGLAKKLWEWTEGELGKHGY